MGRYSVMKSINLEKEDVVSIITECFKNMDRDMNKEEIKDTLIKCVNKGYITDSELFSDEICQFFIIDDFCEDFIAQKASLSKFNSEYNVKIKKEGLNEYGSFVLNIPPHRRGRIEKKVSFSFDSAYAYSCCINYLLKIVKTEYLLDILINYNITKFGKDKIIKELDLRLRSK